MPNAFTVMTSGAVILGDQQAKEFARAIYGGVKKYIAEHKEEYETWLCQNTEVLI